MSATQVVEFPAPGGYTTQAVIAAMLTRLRMIYWGASKDPRGTHVTVLHAVGSLRFYSRTCKRAQRGPARVLSMRAR